MERAVVRAVREAIEATDFSEIERRYKVKISLDGGGSFDPSEHGSARWKLVATPVVDGEVKSREALEFERMATLYGFEPSDLGKTFMSRGRRFKITGLKTRRHKYPISAECLDDGKGYKFPIDSVLVALGRPPQKSVLPLGRISLGR